MIQDAIVLAQRELAAFIEGVNPCVSFTELQLSAILEEVCGRLAVGPRMLRHKP